MKDEGVLHDAWNLPDSSSDDPRIPIPQPALRSIFVRRGITFENYRRFVAPTLGDLHDPSTIHGIDHACERIARAVRDKETILIYGDYDVDGVLGDRTPTAADLDALPYTRGVVAESMRLYPPAWAVGRQATADVELASAAGPRLLPKDAVVLMSQWVTHRDPRWWPDPDKFDPGRWLPDSPEASNRPRYAYYPFGGGPRSCIGEAFAWTEAVLVLATLARQWSLRLARPHEKLDLVPTITLRPRNGLPMVPVTRRPTR